MRTRALRPPAIVLAILSVTSLSLPGPASGAPKRERPRRPHTAAGASMEVFLRYLWDRLPWGSMRKGSCHIDASGLCASSSVVEPEPTGQSEGACHIDPNGQCGS
jgi:hypothetical protein